ncbi:MAG: DUF2089 domain-containing protein [Armatimonadota bacterium]|nr:MAG: DUF2089 domain-containing protein [Armatimonadota bacterium]
MTELTCQTCDLRLQGHFARGCRFCALDPEQRGLLDVFLKCRGVIRDMEKALDLSYPTVRGRVDALLAALGYAPSKAEALSREQLAERRRDILDRLQAGDLTAEEAARELKGLAT